MHRIATHQFKSVNIARTQFEVSILLLGFFHQENRANDLQRVKNCLKLFCLWLFHIESFDYDELAVGNYGECADTLVALLQCT